MYQGNFLIWHRYYIQEYENRLNACGYNGTLCFSPLLSDK
jgi:tyrosinase